MKIGDTVTLYDPGSRNEHESWIRGTIREIIAPLQTGSHPLYIVTINAFKWRKDAPWGEYDGIPEVLARETDMPYELEWFDTWPPRTSIVE
jgi:hypothetical protein